MRQLCCQKDLDRLEKRADGRDPYGFQQQEMQVPVPGNTYTGFLVPLVNCKWYREVSGRCGVF